MNTRTGLIWIVLGIISIKTTSVTMNRSDQWISVNSTFSEDEPRDERPESALLDAFVSFYYNSNFP